MIRLTRNQLKKIKGVVVWDFDHVLFDTERFRKDAERVFEKNGVPSPFFNRAIKRIRREESNFSVALFLRYLRLCGLHIREKYFHRAIHDLLLENSYIDPSADRILHRLRRAGFIHVILSTGAASYQRKKINVGCSEEFRRHFIKILTTKRHKFLGIRRVSRRYPHLPVFFVDDTKSSIDLVRKYVPGVIAVHYDDGWPLKKVEHVILRYARKRK